MRVILGQTGAGAIGHAKVMLGLGSKWTTWDSRQRWITSDWLCCASVVQDRFSKAG
ncbi:hypothetical protein DFAR_110004 [Desulfarculales bacterium]